VVGQDKQRRALHPKKFIISFRVNVQEWELLKQRTEGAETTLTDLLRSCIRRLTQQERHRL
jgi:hypothetical protein